MADVRALLKAKRQETRISHPLATYNQNGQLRCTACAIVIKQASAWEGHVGSKIHRTNVIKMRAEEEEKRKNEERERREERERVEREQLELKRKAEDAMDDDGPPKKRERSGGFPANFFSDPSRTLAAEEEEEEEEVIPQTIDLEWEKFQQDVVNVPEGDDVKMETYQSATIIAEPVMASETPEGFPSRGEQAKEDEEIDEEALRRKKVAEERELIMDRLMDEEMAQEDADMKVVAMKARIEALKQRRALKKS